MVSAHIMEELLSKRALYGGTAKLECKLQAQELNHGQKLSFARAVHEEGIMQEDML